MVRKALVIVLYSAFLQSSSNALTSDKQVDPSAIFLELPSDQIRGVAGVVSVLCPESDPEKARKLLKQASASTGKQDDDGWVVIPIKKETATPVLLLVEEPSWINGFPIIIWNIIQEITS